MPCSALPGDPRLIGMCGTDKPIAGGNIGECDPLSSIDSGAGYRCRWKPISHPKEFDLIVTQRCMNTACNVRSDSLSRSYETEGEGRSQAEGSKEANSHFPFSKSDFGIIQSASHPNGSTGICDFQVEIMETAMITGNPVGVPGNSRRLAYASLRATITVQAPYVV
jgi:hypothetical protein